MAAYGGAALGLFLAGEVMTCAAVLVSAHVVALIWAIKGAQ